MNIYSKIAARVGRVSHLIKGKAFEPLHVVDVHPDDITGYVLLPKSICDLKHKIMT